ncbi:11010_t:CDS:2 [Dentiscutata erythropus]|uniref:11010_t:CDS:1 n=1 Tax=Dentiscutata erythropus TaxID=1348616 RepID=A0A9N9A5H0_9GLOM|nr:11010_t:CDS:2 [Dentiscutata erythropus]
MVHSPFSTELYNSYPVAHSQHAISSVHHLDNMSKSSCNGSDNFSKKRKQDFQYPITAVQECYLPSNQQKSQLIYSQQQSQQLNVAYQQYHSPAMLNSAAWSEYVRSNPSTPTNSPSRSDAQLNSRSQNGAYNMDYLITENLPGNMSLPTSDNTFGLGNLYNSYDSVETSIPVNAASGFSNSYEYGDITNASIASASVGNSPISSPDICGDSSLCHRNQVNDINSTESEPRKNSVNDLPYENLHQPLNELAAAAAMISCNRDDKTYTPIVVDSINTTNVRNNRKPHLMPLNITTTPPNMYRLGDMPTEFGFDSLASSPSPAVTMPPTPVFFEPGFLDGVDGVTNPTITDGFTFNLNTELPTDQLLESTTISRSHSYDNMSSPQHGSVFTSEKIIDNPQTITPAAITITQPNFTPMLTQTPSTLDVEPDYFSVKPLCQQRSAAKSRRNSSVSNPPNIKAEPRTPALSPLESPGTSMSSASSSPPSPSPPHTPTYMRRVSISPTIMEEEEDIMASSANNNNLALVVSNYGSDMSSTVNQRLPQGAMVNLMRPVIQQYLNSTNPAAMGEKTVMVLTSKVAQKSYGTEKRFLCPPPTTLILGSNWWSPHNIGHSQSPTTYSPPKISVGISGELGHQQGILECISSSGNPLDPNACSEMAFSGKCVSKHLYINDADEKRKRVEVLVNIQSPMGHDFGTFASKPIKVISKPSKKRQSVKNMELCIHHGTTISLFNRIRSQTVSTKYLGVSMQSNNQTFGPWNYNNSHMHSGQNEQPHPCFVARTGSWDPFIIWIVDPRYVKGKDDHPPQQPTNANFPRPPPAAIKSNNGNPIPIHYNQPIVLQCLTTGMTSPTMIIRKVDKGSMVIGGGILDSNGHGEAEEALGDPVSQLHKVAFQIKDTSMSSPSTSPTFQSPNNQHLPGPGTYLACLGDVVGMQRANEGRKIITQPSTVPINTNFLDMKPNSSIPSPTDISSAVAAAWASNTTDFSMDSTTLPESAVVTAEGGKVIRKRRVSSSVVVRPTTLSKAALTKNRRRVNSLSGVASEVDLAKFASVRNSVGHRHHDNAGALWTEDVTDAAVWTIVGTDCASYTFYSPQNLISGSMSPSHHLSSLSLPMPVTPLPSISNILSTTSSSPCSIPTSQLQHSAAPNTITIYGDNFTRDLMVWFGDIPSPRTEFRSKDCLVCWLPEELMYEIEHHNNNIKRDISGLQGRHLHWLPNGRMNMSGRPILLSRNDGVVFKTGKVWP